MWADNSLAAAPLYVMKEGKKLQMWLPGHRSCITVHCMRLHVSQENVYAGSPNVE
jgi:hypothetical protein